MAQLNANTSKYFGRKYFVFVQFNSMAIRVCFYLLSMYETTLIQLEIFNAEVLFREDATPDEFIDVVQGNRMYMPCLYVSIFYTSVSQWTIYNK